jgi:methyl coenzyme M reductase subunit D
MNIDEMNKDQLLIFLADLALRQGSVTGEVKFGTDIDELDDFLQRMRDRNESFGGLIYSVKRLTGRALTA